MKFEVINLEALAELNEIADSTQHEVTDEGIHVHWFTIEGRKLKAMQIGDEKFLITDQPFTFDRLDNFDLTNTCRWISAA